jgi:hypothetical protein
MRRRNLRLVPVVLGPLLVLAVTGSATASTMAGAAPAGRAASHERLTATAHRAARSAIAGFVDFNAGTAGTTTYNSTGQGVSVLRDRPGVEVIQFTGIVTAGDAHVSVPASFATSVNASCNVESWFSVPINNPTVLDVEVDCFDNTGNMADEPFDLLITKPVLKPAGVLDYDFVPLAPLSELNTTFKGDQFNSSGKLNSVTHASVGVYHVTMPGSGSAGNKHGTVKVSLTSDQPGSCQVGSWTATKSAQKITVQCFDPTGAPQDMPFTVTYARGNNLMGQNGLTDANATVLANGPSRVYQPAVQFDSVPHAKVTAAHLDVGKYLVFLARSSPTGASNGGDGHIQITPASTHYRHCGYVLLRTHTPKLEVTCTDAAGHPRNTSFTVQWVVT